MHPNYNRIHNTGYDCDAESIDHKDLFTATLCMLAQMLSCVKAALDYNKCQAANQCTADLAVQGACCLAGGDSWNRVTHTG